MALFGFEKETLLDLTVNVIPLGILLFFIGAFAVVNPFGFDAVFSGLQFALMISMFLLLTVLTYYAGKAVEGAEHETETAAIEDGQVASEIEAENEAETKDEPQPELDGETDGDT
jgi:membrane protein implicated in regulation of membrane protease activity